MADPQSAAEAPIVVERSGRIARIVLNRPGRRNALTGPLVTALADAIESLNTDPELTVIVVSGSGGAFCSGLDLVEFALDPPPDWVASFSSEWRRVHLALFDSDKIIIGALERAAVNGGAALALACDFLIVGSSAFIQVGEIQQGMAAPMNLAWLKLRHPESVAARVALLGDRIGGAMMMQLGLAFEVVADEQVGTTTDELATRLAQHEQSGVRRIKTMVRRVGIDDDAAAWFRRPGAADPDDGPSRGRTAPVAARPT